VTSLQAGLRGAPEHDPTWLVFADSLLERGDVRGELITLRHRLAHETLSVDQLDAIEWRIGTIEHAHRAQWEQELAGLPPAEPRWFGGFVRAIRLRYGPDCRARLAAWLDHPAGALLTGLEFVDDRDLGDDEATEIASWPELARLSSLGLRRTALGVPGARALAESPYLGGLERLELRGNHVQAEGLRALAQATSLRSLVHLDVSHNWLAENAVEMLVGARLPALDSIDLAHNRIGNDGARHLAQARWLAGVRTLELGMTNIDGEGARALAHATWWPRLETLSLSNNRLGDPGAAALASVRAPSLRVLRLQGNNLGPLGVRALVSTGLVAQVAHLDLRWNRLGAAGAEALAQAERGSLRSLVLDRNEIGDQGLRALSKSPVLAGLGTLSLGRNHIGDRGVQALTEAPGLSLRALDLWHNDLGPLGAQALADCAPLAHLSQLDLGGNRIGSDGARALAESPHLGRLTVLMLWHANIGNAGAEALARAGFERLGHLDLTYNFISDRGAEALSRAPWLGRVRTLDLRRNDISSEGAEALRRAALDHPDLRIMV